MRRYILKRLISSFFTVLIVTVINFILIHSAPGDPFRILAGVNHPSPQTIAALDHKYGLDQPLIVQFFKYMGRLFSGDLGTSLLYNQSVGSIILGRLGATALLVLTSSILALFIGVALGLLTGRHSNSVMDRSVNGISYFFYAMPPFWLGLMAILFFASFLKVLPTSGMVNLRESYTGGAYVLDVLRHMVLPVGTLTIIQIPIYLRIFRSTVAQTLSENFIKTFEAAGMSKRQIFRRYVFKNSILPTITLFGMNIAYTVAGAALIEIVFAWPGAGRLMLDAINGRDYPLLMGIYLIISISVAVVMLLTDALYALVDPRIRYS